MAENIQIVPFQADEHEHKAVDTLPTKTMTTSALADAVPKFKEWTIGKLFAEFGAKDGLLIYHLYHSDRKYIFDTATSKMNETSSAEGRQAIAEVANSALEGTPWWPGTEPCIMAAISDHFRDTPASVKYVPEVDSWSVVLPMDAMPLGVQSPEHVASFVFNVAYRLRQVEVVKEEG
jgi:hypothetical protein